MTSQALRDPAAAVHPMRVTPAEIVLDALRQGDRVIVSTYNEPLITSEWAVAIFKEARAAGLMTTFVSNGNGTPQVLEYLRPWVDLYKVDLKSFDDRHYRQLGGRLQPITDLAMSLTLIVIAEIFSTFISPSSGQLPVITIRKRYPPGFVGVNVEKEVKFRGERSSPGRRISVFSDTPQIVSFLKGPRSW